MSAGTSAPDTRATATVNEEDGRLTVIAADGTRYVFWAGSCGEEGCDCEDVVLYPIEGENPADSGLDELEELRIDADAALIMDEEGDPLETDSPAFLAALDDALTGPVLDALVRRWHKDKGEPVETGRRDEFLGLEDWELDDPVAWEQVFETLRMDVYIIDGVTYSAMELYNANPASQNDEVIIDFAEELDEDEDEAPDGDDDEDDDEYPIGMVTLRLDAGVEFEAEEGEEETLKQLWKLYERRYPSRDHLRARQAAMKKIGAILLRDKKRS